MLGPPGSISEVFVSPFSDSLMFQYFVKVVPTTYAKLSGKVRDIIVN